MICQTHFRVFQLCSTTLTMQDNALNSACDMTSRQTYFFMKIDECSYFRINFICLESDISNARHKL